MRLLLSFSPHFPLSRLAFLMDDCGGHVELSENTYTLVFMDLELPSHPHRTGPVLRVKFRVPGAGNQICDLMSTFPQHLLLLLDLYIVFTIREV